MTLPRFLRPHASRAQRTPGTKLILLAIPLVILSGVTVPGTATPSGYWRFEEGVADGAAAGANAITDSSSQGDHATPSGGPVYRANVPTSSIPQTGATNTLSLEFDGLDDQVTFASEFPFNQPGDLTLEFWLKYDGEQHDAVLWGRPDDANGSNRFHLYVNPDDTIGFDYVGPTGTFHALVGNGNPSGGAPIPVNVWTHVAIARSGNTYRAYVDGVLQTTQVDSSPDLPNAIGWSLSGRDGFMFNGGLDEFRISSDALEPSEFLIASPIGYWRVEEGTPESTAIGTDSVLDSSSFGNHGTPSGGPFYRADVGANPIPLTGAANTLSLEFDGFDDKVVFGSEFPFNHPGDVTLEFWLKYDGLQHDAVLWGRPDEALGGNRFHLYVNTDATFGFDYSEPGGAFHPVVGEGQPFGGAGPIPLDTWTHIAITRSGNTYRSYINGDLKTEQIDGSPALPDAVGWSLSGRDGFMFNGRLDEVRISPGALAPNQFLRAGSATITVTNANDAGPGSLRDAIDQANSDGNPTLIQFQTGMSGQTIVLSSALPVLWEGNTTIDGDVDANCQPDVGIDGSAVGGNGLSIASIGNIVRGLAINQFTGNGVHVSGDGNLIECNYIGTDLSGTLDRGNVASGVALTDGASDNTIGPGNIIAYNAAPAAPVGGVAVLDGTIPGAYPGFAGLTPAYTNTFPVINFPNTSDRFRSVDNIVPTHSGGQFFSDNFGARFTGTVSVSMGGTYTFTIQNPDDNVRIEVDGQEIIATSCCGSQSANVVLSGTHSIEIDYLENNGSHGFAVQISGPGSASLSSGGQPGLFGEVFLLRVPSERNRVTQNSIFANDRIGIYLDHLDIGERGSNVNDPGDGDVGPNTALNYPVFTTVVDNGGGQFTASGTAPPNATVELFGNPAGAPRGEGRLYLGSVASDAGGNFSTVVTAPAGFTQISATATDTSGNTSEFSAGQTLATTRWTASPVFQFVDLFEPGGFAAGDLNGDGRLDVVGAGRGNVGCRLVVYLQLPDGTFPNISEPLGTNNGLCNGNTNEGLALGDLDADGDLDIVAEGKDNNGAARLLWLSNDGSANFTLQPDIHNFWNGAVALGDVDNDGDLDVVATGGTDPNDAFIGQNLIVFANDGNGGFTLLQEDPLNLDQGYVNGASLALGDIDSDGDVDLIAAGGGAGPRLQLFTNTSGQMSLSQTLFAGGGGEGLRLAHVRLADTDLDGDLDLIAAGENNSGHYLMRFGNTGTAFGVPPDSLPTPSNIQGVSLADANADGYPDLFVNAGTNHYYENQAGTFTDVEQPASNFTGPVQFGDFDGDNDLDIATLPPNNGLYVNTLGPANGEPAAPVGLSSVMSGGGIELTWSGADPETPPNSLTYELRAGTSPGTYNVISGVYGAPFFGTHPPGRLSANQPGRRLRLATGTYYWQVRAIDTGLRAGPWSAEATFDVVSQVGINDVAVVEGNTGTTLATFNVTLSPPSSQQVTVDFQTTGGSATANVDYVTAAGTVTFTAGETSKPIAVTINSDLEVESNETFTVNLSNASNAVISDAEGGGTVLDDDIGISITDASITEGLSGQINLSFAVSLTRASTQTIAVSFSTVDGTATTPSDYGFRSGSLTFTPGTTSQLITVPIIGDATPEPDETFIVGLFAPSNAVMVDDTGLATITDDDASIPPPTRAIWNLAQDGMPTIRGVASNGAVYVAVGDYGHIWTSADGSTWTRRTNPDSSRRNLNAVSYGGGQFVAVGDCCVTGGNVVALTSPDAITWTLRSTPSITGNNQTFGVAFGNGQYVAVGRNGRVMTSPDAIVWTDRPPPSSTLSAVAFGFGRFVAVGFNRTILTSPDGVSWTPVASIPGSIPGNASFSSVTATPIGGGQFALVGTAGILTAPPDAQTWTQRSTTFFPSPSGISTSSDRLVAAGGGTAILTSNDGVNWTTNTLADAGPGPSRTLFTIAHGPAGFVTAGMGGALYTSADGTIPFSSQVLSTSRLFRSVAYGNATYCAVGDTGAVATSTDGMSWINGAGLPAPFGPGSYDFWNSVHFDGSRFVAVGQRTAVMFSTDCASWVDGNPSRLTPGNSSLNAIYSDVVVGTGVFVAVGSSFPPQQINPFIATSPDGTTWTAQNPGFASPNGKRLSALAFGNNRFVAIGSHSPGPQPVVTTSPDAVTWSEQQGPFTSSDSLNDLTFGNGLFVAVGNRVWTSTNGSDWTPRFSDARLVSVTFANGRFTAVGASGVIAISHDGVSWTLNSSPTVHSLNGVAYSDSFDRFAAVGDSAIVYSSGYTALSIAIGDATVTEGNGGVNAVFNVMLSSTSAVDVTVEFNTADGTAAAGVDYQGGSGPLTFPAGSTSPQTVTVPITGDTLGEANENFFVQLSNATNATIADGSGFATIVDDDAPAVRIIDRAHTEGNSGTSEMSFIVTLTRPSAAPVTVMYETVAGSAADGSDFQPVSGSLILPPGTTNDAIGVPIFGDTTVESLGETFFVNITGATGASIEDGQAVGTISDDDATPMPTWIKSQEGMPNMRGGAFGASTYVMVGDYGHIWTSTDAINWTNRTTPTTFRSLRAVAFGNGQFVAVGQAFTGPEVMTSPDGITWTVRDVSAAAPVGALLGVTYGNGQFVAVGVAGLILTSADGVTWTTHNSGSASNLTGVAFGGSAFVAVGLNRTVLHSTDGATWAAQSVPSSVPMALNAVTHTGTQFVVVGNPGAVLTSPDGTTWTQRFAGVQANLFGVASGGGVIAAVGGGTAITSSDGIVWTVRGFDPNPSGHGVARALNAVTFGAAGFVALGNGGGIYHAGNGLGTWISRTLAASRNLRSIAISDVGYCAVGNFGSIAKSSDGINWTNHTGLGATPQLANLNWTAVARGASHFVAVGNAAEIMRSPDCQTWSEQNAGRLATPHTGITGLLSDVIYANNRFVAVGAEFGNDGLGMALIAISDDDGMTWQQVDAGLPSPADHGLEAVAYGAGRFVAIGRRADSGVDVTTSIDGSTWTAHATNAFDREAVIDITFGNDMFVAVGSRVWTSPDGLSWTKTGDLRLLNGVTFANGLFVAAGNNGAIYTSFDGAHWVQNSVPSNNTTLGVAYLPSLGRYAAVGDSAIVYSGGVAPLQISIADVTVAENAGSALAVVTLSRMHPTEITIDVAAVNGLATTPADYGAVAGSIVFAPGQTSQPVVVPITDDLVSEDTESLHLKLSNANLGSIVDPLSVVTITDDEPVALSVADVTMREGTGGSNSVTFLVSLSRSTATPVTVGFTTVDGSATVPSDYASRGGTLTFNPGQRTTIFTVPIITDASIEPDETFAFQLFNASGATIADGSGVATIVDDDATIPAPSNMTWSLAQDGMPTLRGIASNGPSYIAVGDYGHIWGSSDGVSWTRRSNPDGTLRNLQAVTYAGGQFVAVGECCFTAGGPAILTSPDGVSWTLRPTQVPGRANLAAITYDGEKYVAAGQVGRVISSPDGINWTTHSSPTSQQLTGIAFGAGRFVAIGGGRTILTSNDLATWSPAPAVDNAIPANATLSAVSFTSAGNQFVLSGSMGIATSPDGLTWTFVQASPFAFSGIASSNDRVVIVAAGAQQAARTSTDGVSWPITDIAPSGPGESRRLLAVAHGNVGFVAAGVNGAIYESADGVAPFESHTLATSRFFAGIANGNGVYCAVGDDGLVAKSTDGAAWTYGVGVPQVGPTPRMWRGILFDGARFLAVGSFGGFMTSSDCETWVNGNAGNSSLGGPDGPVGVSDIALGAGMFVAVGTRTPPGTQLPLPALATSPDGITWTHHDPGVIVPENRSLNSVAFGDGKYVAFGRQSGPFTLITSADGITWTERFVPEFAAESPNDVVFGNGIFVAVGQRVWTSPDGISWTLVPLQLPASLNSASYGNGRFVAVGGRGVIVSSTDGTTWTENTSPTTHNLITNSVAYSATLDRFVAAGDSTVVYSGAFVTPTLAIGSITVTESDAPGVNAVFNVSLSSTTSQPVTVNFTMADAGATAGSDYVSSSGVVTFPADSSAPQQLVVPIEGDTVAEPNEQFFVVLSSPANAQLDPVSTFGVATILDNERPALTITDRAIGEGNAGAVLATFSIQLNRPATAPVTVNYATSSGTAGANDYVAVSGTATIPAGSLNANVAVSVVGDTRNEPNETFFVNLTAPANATIQDAQAVGTIVDDEQLAAAQWTRAQEGMPTMRAGAFNGTTYVIVGDAGDIWTSTDAVNWINRSVTPAFPVARFVRAVVYANNQFVAVGQSGVHAEALTSPDGMTWTAHDLSAIQPVGILNGVAFGNGLYVAVGPMGIMTSPDGSTWSARDPGTSSALNSVAFGGGVFVAVGADRAVIRSTDGITWVPQTAPTDVATLLNAITHNGADFVAVGAAGSVMTSSDGIVWTRRFAPTNAALLGVTSGGGLTVAVGGGAILTSTDGVGWTQRSFATPSGNGLSRNLQSVVRGAAGFVAIGGAGHVYTSSDGISPWISQSLVTSRTLSAIAIGTAGFCAVGNFGTVASSPDGIAWTNRTSPAQASNIFWRSLAHGAGTFVAVGDLAEIIASPDCVTWTERHAGRLTVPSGQLRDVTFGNNLFVAVGTAAVTTGPDAALIMTSPDGETWTPRQSNLPASAEHVLQAVAFGGGRFVAIGTRLDRGIDVITSTDGLTWSIVPTSTFNEEFVADIVYANGMFVAAGTRVWTSLDGLTWTKTADVRGINGLTFGDDLFVGVSAFGGIYSSPDAINWIQNPAETAHSLFGVTYSSSLDRFVAVGESTVQYSSGVGPPSLSINDVTMLEGDSGPRSFIFTVSLSRAVSQTVRVDYTTANQTALAGSDYVSTSGTLAFSAGQLERQIVVTVNGDFDTEPAETFLVNLSNAVSASLADSEGLGTIVNDDVTPAVSISDVSIVEGDSNRRDLVFTLTLSSPAKQQISVDFATADGTAIAGSDYVANSGTIVFNAGQSMQTVVVKVNGDVDAESTESLWVNLTNPLGLTIADAQGTGTIITDDTLPIVTIEDGGIIEGNSGRRDFAFTLRLSAPAKKAVTVSYATSNGSALAGSDYVATGGTVRFGVGATTATVVVRIQGDRVFEANETFFMNLTTVSEAVIGDSQATCVIFNDDSGP